MYVCARICLPMSNFLSSLQQHMHVFYLIPTMIGRTYVSICKYMHVFLSKIHAHTSVNKRISNSISGSIFVCIVTLFALDASY